MIINKIQNEYNKGVVEDDIIQDMYLQILEKMNQYIGLRRFNRMAFTNEIIKYVNGMVYKMLLAKKDKRIREYKRQGEYNRGKTKENDSIDLNELFPEDRITMNEIDTVLNHITVPVLRENTLRVKTSAAVLVFRLRYFKQMTGVEIQKKTKVSKQTQSRYIQLVLIELKKHFEVK